MQELLDWLSYCSQTRRDWGVTAQFNQLHPRAVFFKLLPQDARFFDVGAGEGSMALFKDWLEPKRQDVKLTGLSLKPGTHQAKYEKWLTEFWTPNMVSEQWDAIFACHFIEHLDDPHPFVRWASKHLKPGGRIYLEWPEPATISLPRVDDLRRPTGVPLMISNFRDDATHAANPPEPRRIASALLESGFEVETDATITMPYFTDKLMQQHFATGDAYLAQAAFWLKTKWCHHIVASKI